MPSMSYALNTTANQPSSIYISANGLAVGDAVEILNPDNNMKWTGTVLQTTSGSGGETVGFVVVYMTDPGSSGTPTSSFGTITNLTVTVSVSPLPEVFACAFPIFTP